MRLGVRQSGWVEVGGGGAGCFKICVYGSFECAGFLVHGLGCIRRF